MPNEHGPTFRGGGGGEFQGEFLDEFILERRHSELGNEMESYERLSSSEEDVNEGIMGSEA